MNRPRQTCRWHVYPSPTDLEIRAAQAIERAAVQAISARGRFVVVLAGGNTPRAIYSRLARVSADWTRWHIYFGDERCLPADDAGRNDRMTRDAWLDRVPIPRRQIHGTNAERGPAEAASQYTEVLAPLDRFDLVLLGLGEDGHTASLFAGESLDTSSSVIPVYRAPKPPPERVSLTTTRLSRTQQVMFLVSGSAKRGAVVSWRRGGAVPAAWIAPPDGVDILLDRDAWSDDAL